MMVKGLGASGPDGGRRVEERAVQISVIGSAVADEDVMTDAESVGRGIAEAGAVLVCGGRSGVMEAASRGPVGPGS